MKHNPNTTELIDQQPNAQIMAALVEVPSHMRRVKAAADDTTRTAAKRYTAALLKAMLRLRREVLRG